MAGAVFHRRPLFLQEEKRTVQKFNWKLEVLPPAVFGLLALGVFQQTARMKSIESIFPRLLAGIMLVSAIALLVITLVQRRAVVNTQGMNSPQVLIVVGIMVLYIVLLPYAGYILCSIALGSSLTFLLGYRRIVPLLVGSTVFTAAVFVVFSVFLKVPLPTLL
jgi:hypothetical protein